MRRKRSEEQPKQIESIITVKEILEAKDLPRLYKEFTKDLPKEALRIEVTDKGDNLYIYGYQFIINRLNEIVGLDHWHYEILKEPDKEKRDTMWWVSMHLRLHIGNWLNGQFSSLTYREAFGSGIHESLGNAQKGAMTNALKKAASMFGIGKKVFEGLVEEFDTIHPTNKVVEAKEMLLNKEEFEVTKKIEEMLIRVNDKDSLLKVLAEYDKIKASLNDKQIKYIDFLVGRLEKKFMNVLIK